MPAVRSKAELQGQKNKVSQQCPMTFMPTQTAALSPQLLNCHALTTCDPKLANSYHELLEYVARLCTEGVLEKDYTETIVHYREFSSKELRTVGNYTLGRLIGKGSFGKVYLASHKLTNGSKVGLLLLEPRRC